MKMKKIRIMILAALMLLPSVRSFAQDDQFIFDMPDDFAEMDTLPQPQRFKSIHMVGVKYSYDLCYVNSSPRVGQSYLYSPVNLEIAYTYYHALWDHLFNFGLQVGVKYGTKGYKSEYAGYGDVNTVIEFPLISQFKIDVSRFRILADIGPYYGYRLDTAKPEGWDQYDIRHDYGFIGGVGVAMVFGRFDLQVEGCYQYSLCSMYHTNKFSDVYWLFTCPRNILLSAGIFFHLW